MCKRNHHECDRKYSEDWCCSDCSEQQQEMCIEYDKICDCQWDVCCSLEEDIYKQMTSSRESYVNHIKENKPNNIILE